MIEREASIFVGLLCQVLGQFRVLHDVILAVPLADHAYLFGCISLSDAFEGSVKAFCGSEADLDGV